MTDKFLNKYTFKEVVSQGHCLKSKIICPKCFKIIRGCFTSINTAILKQCSNFKPTLKLVTLYERITTCKTHNFDLQNHQLAPWDPADAK